MKPLFSLIFSIITLTSFSQVNIQWSTNYPYTGASSGTFEPADLITGHDGYIYVTGKKNNTHVYLQKNNINSSAGIWNQTYSVKSAYPKKVSLDPHGNIYVLALLPHSYPDSTKQILLKYSPSGILKWAKTLEFTTQKKEIPVDLKITSTGKIFVASTHNNNAIAINRVDTSGNLIFQKTYNTGMCSAQEMAVDQNENVFIVGTSDNDFLTLKYDPSLNFQWSKKFNLNTAGFGNSDDIGSAIKVDKKGNIIVAGTGINGSSNGNLWTEFTLIKYEQNGNTKWLKSFLCKGGYGIDNKVEIDVDPVNNNIFYSVITDSTWTNGSTQGIQTGKVDANGNLKWKKNIWEYWNPKKGKIQADRSGNIYVTGEISQQLSKDVITVKYDSLGNKSWYQTYSPTNGEQHVAGLVLDSCNRAIIAGYNGSSGSSEQYGFLVAYKNSEAPLIASSPNICKGDSTQLVALSTFSQYTWSPSSTLTDPLIYNPAAFPSVTTTYTLTAANNYGCIRSSNITVTVIPNNLNAGNDQTMNLGQTTALYGTGASSYTWNPSDNLSSPNTASTFCTATSTTKYFLTGTFSSCVYKDSVTINVTQSPLTQGEQMWVWAKNSNSLNGAKESINAIVPDGNGNVIVTGVFSNSLTINGVTYAASGTSDIFVAKLNNFGEYIWFTKAGSSGVDESYDLALDSNGDVTITGHINAAASFGSISVGNTGYVPFIAKYNSSGQPLWVKTGTDFTFNSIATDKNRNIYIAGYFAKTATYGGYSLTTGSTNTADYHVIWAKLNPSGSVLWMNKAGGTGNDQATDIQVDTAGNVYVAGNYNSSTATFGSFTITRFSAYDGFLFKSNNSGVISWIKQQKKSASIYSPNTSIAINPISGTTYLTGSIAGTNTIDGYTLTSNGDVDLYVLKYDANGTLKWARSAGGTKYDNGQALSLDHQENVYVAGRYYSPSLQLGSTTLNNSTGKSTIFVSKIDSAGAFKWTTNTLSTGNDMAKGISYDASGIYVAGYIGSLTNFDTLKIKSTGSENFFLSRLKGLSTDKITISNASILGADSCLGTFPISVNIKNDGSTTITSIVLTASINGTTYSKSWTGNLAPGQETDTIILANHPFVAGNANIDVVAIANSLVDDQATLFKMFKGVELDLGADTLICSGNQLTLQIPAGFVDASWSTGETSTNITINASQLITVVATDTTGCLMNDSIKADFALCSQVWPGDANDDLIVNNYDLLPIGVHYGETGYSRDSISNVWFGHQSYDWQTVQASGTNAKHIDCNGDGSISDDDTLAISQNYLQTHPRSSFSSGGLPLVSKPLQPYYMPGQPVTIELLVGDSANQTTDFYGLALTFSVDPSSISPGSLSMVFSNGWVGTQHINIAKAISTNIIEGAIVKTDHTPLTGHGKIAEIHFVINPNMASDQTIATSIDAAKIINSNGGDVPVTPFVQPVNVVMQPTSVQAMGKTKPAIDILNNPIEDQLRFKCSNIESAVQIEILNTLGSVMFKNEIEVKSDGQELALQVPNMAAGVYFIRFTSKDFTNTSRILLKGDQ